MKISEMEVHHDQYLTLESQIRAMVDGRKFLEAFSVCLQSFPNIVPAIKFRKQRGIEPETPSLLAFGTICKYAPPLFEHVALESLATFVKSERVLARHENDYVQDIESALAREEIARVLWNHIERQPGVIQRHLRKELGVDQDAAVVIVELWEQLGVISRRQEDNSYRLYFRSRFDVEAEGVCPACGVRGKGRKELFFKRTSCKKCGAEGYYHITYADF